MRRHRKEGRLTCVPISLEEDGEAVEEVDYHCENETVPGEVRLAPAVER